MGELGKQDPEISTVEKDVQPGTATAPAKSQEDKSKEDIEKNKKEPVAVQETVAEKIEEKTDITQKKTGDDSQKEKESEPEKDIKAETAPDKSLSVQEAEELGKQVPEISTVEKDVQPETATAPAKSQEDKSKEDIEKNK